MNTKKREMFKKKNYGDTEQVHMGSGTKKLKNKTDAHESHIAELQLHHKTTTTAIKNFTIMIIVKITGTFIQSFLSFFACVVYVVGTYYPDQEDKTTETGQIFFLLEIFIAALFSVDYLVGIFLQWLCLIDI